MARVPILVCWLPFPAPVQPSRLALNRDSSFCSLDCKGMSAIVVIIGVVKWQTIMREGKLKMRMSRKMPIAKGTAEGGTSRGPEAFPVTRSRIGKNLYPSDGCEGPSARAQAQTLDCGDVGSSCRKLKLKVEPQICNINHFDSATTLSGSICFRSFQCMEIKLHWYLKLFLCLLRS